MPAAQSAHMLYSAVRAGPPGPERPLVLGVPCGRPSPQVLGLHTHKNLIQQRSDMPLADDVKNQLRQFLLDSGFAHAGAVITDLDGTAVLEYRGRISIPEPVEFGLKRLRDLGRPVILNSLRFPLSVIRTFGREWYRIANAPIPTVSLKGSLLGYVTRAGPDELVFEEVAAFPLSLAEIGEILRGVKGLLDGGVRDIVLFYYPRDWTAGEIIWTPVPEKVAALEQKYLSASSVIAVEFAGLEELLAAQAICMIFLLIEVEEDQLMAYQHTKRNNFFTREGVDKLSGAKEFASRVGADLAHSVGAGDTELDSFLTGVGLAVLVGNADLEFRGRLQTVRLRDSFELGELLFSLADMQRGLSG
jgi:hydroxymethylpyrimidine pyrophosphatase-like HAD family hydrolase